MNKSQRHTLSRFFETPPLAESTLLSSHGRERDARNARMYQRKTLKTGGKQTKTKKSYLEEKGGDLSLAPPSPSVAIPARQPGAVDTHPVPSRNANRISNPDETASGEKFGGIMQWYIVGDEEKPPETFAPARGIYSPGLASTVPIHDIPKAHIEPPTRKHTNQTKKSCTLHFCACCRSLFFFSRRCAH